MTIGLGRDAHHRSGFARIEIKDCVDNVGQTLLAVQRHQHRLRAAQRHLPRFEFVLRGQGTRITSRLSDVCCELQALRQRLIQMNPRAQFGVAERGISPMQVLDIKGFNLNAILDIEPDFLTDVQHDHDDDVSSFVFRESRPMDMERLDDLLGGMIQVYGPNLMRYKGVIHGAGLDRRVVLQGVHMLMGSELGTAWKPNEARETKIVFIGRDMPKEVLLLGLSQCVAVGSEATLLQVGAA